MKDHPELESYPVVHTREVQWGEMDALGHVNNTVYFRYFETARIKYFEAMGFEDLSFDDSVGPIVANLSTDYRKPVQYPDTIHIGTGVTDMGNSRFDMEYTLVSEELETVAAEGECVIVSFDFADQKPVRVPDYLREKIEEFEDT
jgi:acyl-CoA thioester hydrolase